MSVLALQPIQVPGEVATKAGLTLIESGVLGTLLVVSVLANVALVWLLVRVMNKRVEDSRKIADVTEKMVATFGEVKNTLDNLDDGSNTQAAALQALNATMQTLLLSTLTRSGMLSQGHLPQSGGNNSTGGTG